MNSPQVPMDHRWNTRTDANVNVTLKYDRLGLVTGTTRDLSLGGAYIHTKAVDMGVNSQLQVRFQTDNGGISDFVELPATVVHSGNDGVGLMFTDYAPSSVTTLAGLLTSAGLKRL
ncbi:MAG: PilZ domain-containing protein [Pseudomonadota bacterium]|nr:MAG: PilZ domain-containing protein [Pseudomonadota bacterium]